MAQTLKSGIPTVGANGFFHVFRKEHDAVLPKRLVLDSRGLAKSMGPMKRVLLAMRSAFSTTECIFRQKQNARGLSHLARLRKETAQNLQ
jgi:hypothetical protein